MRINKSLITFTPTSGSGSGTVTSVAMTVPNILGVIGTPITTSGTFQLFLVNQLANTVFAGPTTGAEDIPTFRGLVSDDIPNLSTSKITSGTLGVARGGTGATTLTGVLFGNGTGAFTGLASTTANQMLRVNSVGTAYEWFTPDYLSNVMTSLGDMIYGNAVGLPVRRSGNITTTKMYLSQTGDGTNSAAPQWSGIAVGDVSGAVSALTGEVSTTGSGSLNVTLGTTAVTGKLLTGLSVTSGAITSSDSILSAFGKVQGQINGLAGGSTYKGSWNASTNTPTIVSGTGTTGDYYIVSTAGSTTIDGVSSWDVGDWIIFSGTVWQKIDNTDSVISVNGQVGAVVLTTTDITEGTRLYYTDTRARAAISLTTTGASGAATYSSGVLNIPNYTLSGLGGISGSGTTNYISKFTSDTSIADSIIYDNGTNVGIGTSSLTSGYKLQVNGLQRNINTNTVLNFGELDANNIYFQALNLAGDSAKGFVWLGISEYMRIASNGNVGIGTTNPTAKIEINTNTNAASTPSSTLTLSNIADGGHRMLFKNGAGNLAAIDGDITSSGAGTDDGVLRFWTSVNGTLAQNMTILSGGNVGIGTTAPSSIFTISKASSNFIFDLENASETSFRLRTYNNGTGSAPGICFTYGLYYNTTENTSIKFYRGGSATGGFLGFTTNDGTERVRIDVNGQLKFNQYTSSSSFSGTIAGLLAFDSSGNVITTNLAGVGGVPTSRTITINGTTQDLSANRTYSVGTVTSVNASVPTGFAVGSAVTTSGNIAISFAAGYALPTTASQTTWDAAYNDKINSASVTGATTKTLTLTQQDGGTITASWTDINTDAVASVFGRTGAVVATSGDYNTSQVTENVANLYYTEARVDANTNVAANTAARHNALTIGTANGLSLSTQVLSLGLASGSTNGALSSTDWTTFNNKQSTLTNPVTGNGAGAIGYFPKFSGVNAIENSNFFESGTGLYYGGGSASEYSLQIGHGRSGNGFAYIDLIGDTTYTDYGMRFIRGNSGANSTSTIEHRGTGDFIFKGVDASTIKFQTGSTDRMIVDSAGRVGIGFSPSYTLDVNGSIRGNGNIISTGGGAFAIMQSTSNSIVTVIRATGGGTNVMSTTTWGDNIAIGTQSNSDLIFASNNTERLRLYRDGYLIHATATNPTASSVAAYIQYSSDVNDGNAAPHFRTENGAVIKLYQQTTGVGNAIFSAGGGTSVLDDSTFDGYTLRQIVKALRNLGILQ